MALEFNPAALNMFKAVNFGNDDAIANLDGEARIKQNGKLGSFVWKIFRSSATEARNNAVRTELLKSLGQAFKLDGMSEQNGKVTFSKDFMDRLASLLGPALKLDDFGIAQDGSVASGKPLTQRRIKAIVTKAETAAACETVSTGKSSNLSKLGGIKKTNVYGPYAEKLAAIQKEVAGEQSHVTSFFNRVASTLDYLYEELDISREKPEAPDPSAIRMDQAFEFSKVLGDIDEDEPGQFEFYDNKAGKYRPYKESFSDFLWNRLGGGLLHIERAHFSNGTSVSIEPLKKYIIDNARLFVMKSIDTYIASKQAGKLAEFFEHLKNPGACIEQQCVNLINFEANHLTKGEAISAKEKAELEKIADGKPADLPENAVNQFMDVLSDFEDEEWFSKDQGWNKQTADGVKAQLRGKKCVMQNFDAPHKLGAKVPDLLGENGLPVVKVLTDDLIDELGPKILREYFRV